MRNTKHLDLSFPEGEDGERNFTALVEITHMPRLGDEDDSIEFEVLELKDAAGNPAPVTEEIREEIWRKLP